MINLKHATKADDFLWQNQWKNVDAKKKLERISLDSICCIEEELNKMKFNIWIFFPMKMDTLGIAKLL